MGCHIYRALFAFIAVLVATLAAAAPEAPSSGSDAIARPPQPEALVGYTRAAWDLQRRSAADRGLEQLLERKIDDSWSLT